MRYYSTNHRASDVSLGEAVERGLAPDNGLYMPERIKPLPPSLIDGIERLTFHEIAYGVASAFFGEDVPAPDLRRMVAETLTFDTPAVQVNDRIYSLELFHGPTASFKDVGARFMARMLSYFISQKSSRQGITVLTATSGDTGSAVANGFLGVKGVRVVVLYPKGKVSEMQERQFATLGKNITAIEVDGTFDDCLRLVRSALADRELNERVKLTSANSINIARCLPQAFYYFHGYAQMKRRRIADQLVVSVPGGNPGNLTAGLFGYRMGLPVKRFIAACGSDDELMKFLRTGQYEPSPSAAADGAVDADDPGNLARILDLYGNDAAEIRRDVSGYAYSEEEARECIARVYKTDSYILDPHGACAYMGLEEGLRDGETGLLLATAHPAKFPGIVEQATGSEVKIPAQLRKYVSGTKESLPMGAGFDEFRKYLLSGK